MITELTRVQAEAQNQSYEKNVYEKYKFLALNPYACDICNALDGKIFDVSDMMPGENAEPMHPRCHCSPAPYMDRKAFERKIAFKEKGGTDEEWNRLKNKDRLVAKRSESGIIKASNTKEDADVAIIRYCLLYTSRCV